MAIPRLAGDAHRAVGLALAQRIGDQVGQRTAQQLWVGCQRARGCVDQCDAAFLGHPFEVIAPLRHRCVYCDGLAVQHGGGFFGARQKQHVVNHAGQAPVLLDVGSQQCLVLIAAARPVQGQFGLAHQVVQRGAHLKRRNSLSVLVLNLQDGLPSPGVKVLLEKQDGKHWIELSSATTNVQGRVHALFPEGKTLDKGNYRVTFKTGEWFAANKTVTFFPEVPVIFTADGTVPHFHIPLLLSPYGFSTYRGN